MIDERMKLLAGQRLVAGFEGYTVPESFQKLIRDCKIGNVILFRRNIRERGAAAGAVRVPALPDPHGDGAAAHDPAG